MNEYSVTLLRPTNRYRPSPLQQFASVGAATISYVYSYGGRAALAFHAQGEAASCALLVGMEEWSRLPNGALAQLAAPITENAVELLIRTDLRVCQGRLCDPENQ